MKVEHGVYDFGDVEHVSVEGDYANVTVLELSSDTNTTVETAMCKVTVSAVGARRAQVWISDSGGGVIAYLGIGRGRVCELELHDPPEQVIVKAPGAVVPSAAPPIAR